MLGCGESQKEVIRPDFNRAIRIDFQGAKITSARIMRQKSLEIKLTI